MQVGTEFTFRALTLHGGNHLVTDDKATDIGATGLLDEFLHQDVGFQPHEGFDHAFRSLTGFRQHNTNALGALQKLDNHRRTTHHFQQLGYVIRLVGEAGHRHAHAFSGQQLQ